MPKKTALLIDANALLHRAWHALPPLTSPSGQMVNAVYGFTNVLLKVLENQDPEYLVVCWDTEAPTFRHKAAPEYKAQREEQPQELYDQVPLIKDVVTGFGGTNVELDGYEADDLLGTFATQLSRDGIDVLILTSDRDAWQLIGPHIRVMAFKKGVSETVIYDEAMLKEVTGLTPNQFIDYKAMRGDASDNLKGIPGIGDKTATELLLKFGHLDAVLAAAHNAKSDISASVRQKLVDGEKAARDTYPLVRIVTDVPLVMETSAFLRRPADREALQEVFTRVGFKTLRARILGKEEEKTESQKKVAPVRGKKSASAENIQITNVKELQRIIDEARNEHELIVYPIIVAQASLFSDSPVLALGSQKTTAVITQTVLESEPVAKALKEIFADSAIHKIGHTMKNAWHWCHDRELSLEGITFDTEIAAYLLASGDDGYSLDALAKTELGIEFSASDARVFEEVSAIRALRSHQESQLQEQNLTTILTRFELPLIPTLGVMENWGILIDRPYFKRLTDDFRATKQRLEAEMKTLAGEEFNPASPSQLAHILFETLKLPIKGIKRGKTGFSTAASELEKLEGTHPIIEKISQYREVAKLLSTYVETLPQQADAQGRVHTTFTQTIAATGRLSSINPNLQNIPIRTEEGRKIRRGFIAEKGFTLLSCDYSQIELRVVAALAKDAKMLEAFENGIDIHTATAAAIWHVPLKEVTKEQRRAAKAVNFGIIYGQGPHGLSKAAGVSFEEAKNFIQEYFHVYSGVREYLDQTKALAHTRGYVETLFGRRRPIPEINSPLPQLRAAAERMAINMPVQGTATGDLVKLAMIELGAKLPKIAPNARLLLQVHDEIVLEVPEKEVKKVAKAVQEIMANVEKIGVPIVVDAKAGKNWDEMEAVV